LAYISKALVTRNILAQLLELGGEIAPIAHPWLRAWLEYSILLPDCWLQLRYIIRCWY